MSELTYKVLKMYPEPKFYAEPYFAAHFNLHHNIWPKISQRKHISEGEGMGKRLFCKYCGDPILDFQKKTMRDGMHEGCAKLKDEGIDADEEQG